MTSNNNIESVKKTKSIPKSGLVQGGEPPKISDDDAMWEGIMKAGNRGSIGKSIAKK